MSALKDQLKSDVVDVQKGIKIVFDALLAPIAQIAENAGYNAEEIVDAQKKAEKMSASMPRPASGSTCSKRASSIRRRLLAAHC